MSLEVGDHSLGFDVMDIQVPLIVRKDLLVVEQDSTCGLVVLADVEKSLTAAHSSFVTDRHMAWVVGLDGSCIVGIP